MELQDRLLELQASGYNVAAISYDSQEVLTKFSRTRGITFPLLSDQGSSVITEFGILNTVAAEGLGSEQDRPEVAADVLKYVSAFGANAGIVGTPFPGTFVLDAQARVTSRHFEEYYRERNTTANVMLKLGLGLSPLAATQHTTGHLKLTSYASNPVVSTGARFSIVVEVEPNPDIHVYAPGAETMGYRVVQLTLAPTPHLRFESVEFPASQIYHFEPLNERVPVYQQSFRLLKEIVVEATPEAEQALAKLATLTINGTFDYQACDHKVCYPPVSVPLSFTIDLEPHET